jgi:predicted AlkP superfamily pyrophosphatase or phosphodiesterase
MPIHKKDRSFQNIVRDTNIDEVPLDYIERLILVLESGDRVIFEGEDMRDIEEPNIVMFVMSAVDELGQDYGSPVRDIEIVIDYTRLEKEIRALTKGLLDKDSNDQSNTSV